MSRPSRSYREHVLMAPFHFQQRKEIIQALFCGRTFRRIVEDAVLHQLADNKRDMWWPINKCGKRSDRCKQSRQFILREHTQCADMTFGACTHHLSSKEYTANLPSLSPAAGYLVAHGQIPQRSHHHPKGVHIPIRSASILEDTKVPCDIIRRRCAAQHHRRLALFLREAEVEKRDDPSPV